MLNGVVLSTVASQSDLGGAFSAERLALAGQMTLIGMGMIFAVLAILWGVLVIFKLIFTRKPKKKTKNAEELKAESAVAPTPAVVENVETDDGELIAVITAAVAAYRADTEDEADAGSFRVVSFRRTNGGRAWNSK